MDLTARIGARIREARARKEFSQSDLARAVQKPRQHLSQIEQGKQQPRAELLLDIADVLGVSTDYLLGRTEPDAPPAVTSTRQETPAPAPTARRKGHARDGTQPAPATNPEPEASLPMCPHCAMPMQPLGDGSRVGCPGCRYSVAGET
jgi:transcriptional regulator with XRE-family HTH domain